MSKGHASWSVELTVVLPRYASMPDIEEQLKDRMEALAAAQERQGTAEEHCSMVRIISCNYEDDGSK